MKEWVLSQRKVTLVDDDVFGALLLLNKRWSFNSSKTPSTIIDGKTVLMHRWIVGAERGATVTHINNDKLDNRRANLQVVQHAASHYRGVSPIGDSFIASFKRKSIGTWPTLLLAASARDHYCIDTSADAPLNFVDGIPHTRAEVSASSAAARRGGYPGKVDPRTHDAITALGSTWWVGDTGYAVSDIQGKRTYLHRWVMHAPKGKHVDHINGDKLDNRIGNLRIVTASENLHNQTKPTKASLGFRGVRMIDGGNFAAYVNYGNKQVHLGSWPTDRLAALARDQYVRKHHPTAPLNFTKYRGKYADVAKTKINPKRNKYPGVRFKNGAWEAWGRKDGKKVYIGRFGTEDAAHAAQGQA